ncbi:MAG: RtcB family protein [Kofleriaceae bacterium]|nr:RtcB family protein [Kofleriaceae bacterium]MBP9166264.1 RtcB family protein [Kofleriaceae bacterium]MBP9859071.1 RtcB family protein [Kofleriaceae bacterium]
MDHELIETAGVPIRAWVRGVQLEDAARRQLENVARLPIVFHHVAAMPDVHWGIGATVGSVIATERAIIPAAVGVDLGCGMMAVETSLWAADLPDHLGGVRTALEAAIPHGRTDDGGRNDRGAWRRGLPARVAEAWTALAPGYAELVERHPKLGRGNDANHLATLGTGNHFVEICLDERDRVWAMLHSGSRGVGNRIGTYFIELAKRDMKRQVKDLPDHNLAYLKEGSRHFDDYVAAVEWAQGYAATNRALMMDAVLAVLAEQVRPLTRGEVAVNCHHNYVARERHFGHDVFVTRKGAVRARLGDLGIIPGSMGAKSFIVRGKGNPLSYCSCSHGAGRAMSRGDAKRRFTVADHAAATAGVECRKDADVIDETPAAYKPIDAVMAAQAELIDVVHTLRQVVCVKG